ncbi:MAG TPA: class I SAM-dependent methyltransferase [Phormidium sp.]
MTDTDQQERLRSKLGEIREELSNVSDSVGELENSLLLSSNAVEHLCLPGFEIDIEEWTTDDWQTPSKESKSIANLIRLDELDILEPAAGTGQLIQFIEPLPGRTITAVEIKTGRVNRGKERFSEQRDWVHWINKNFITYQFQQKFDLILSNIPFSLKMEFIEKSLTLLRPEGRLLFLMPIDFNCGVENGNRWQQLDCHIHHVYVIHHRVAYLNAQGVPQKGRQVHDAVFDIRLGRQEGGRSFL